MIHAFLAAVAATTAFGIVDVDQHGRGGGLAANRIGLRGSETLGNASGGLAAAFWLETGFVPATGRLADPRRAFSRRTTVSLQSRRFGELRLGRDFAPAFLGYSFYDAFGATGVAAVNRFVPAGFQDRQVSYVPPLPPQGVQWQFSAAPAERMAAVRMRYTDARLDASLAVQGQRLRDGGAKGGTLATGGLAYAPGETRLMAAFALVRGQRPVFEAGTQWRHWRASYILAAQDQVALGYVHEVSAQTALYATVTSDGHAQLGARQQF